MSVGGITQRFVLPPAGKRIFSFLGPSGSGRAVHPQRPPTTEHCSSAHPAFPLGLPPWVSALPQVRLLPVSQTEENPTKGPFQLSLPLLPGRTSLLRPPRSWCGTYPGPHTTFGSARADQAGTSHNTLCVHPRATAGAEKALYGHREKQTAFCTAAFQFTDIHQLSLQRKASNFLSPLGMKALGLRRPKYDPGSYCLETGSSNQLFIQEL